VLSTQIQPVQNYETENAMVTHFSFQIFNQHKAHSARQAWHTECNIISQTRLAAGEKANRKNRHEPPVAIVDAALGILLRV
jgi:hypothetical protein